METTVTEIADGIYRLSTLTDAVPGGFTFNQFLVKGEDPLLSTPDRKAPSSPCLAQ
jgi:hypothetical protein